MANNLAGNPLYIDTSGAGDLLGASQVCWVLGFWWDPVGAGAVSVTDTAGTVLFGATAAAGQLQPVGLGLASGPGTGLQVKGLKVPTLTGGGKVLIYLDRIVG